MKCFRSFTFVSRDNGAFGGANIDTWANGTTIYWAVEKLGVSTFELQGFKNVDVYSIEAVGDFLCDVNTGDSAIINDWSMTIQINGQVPLISGSVNTTLNEFGMKPAAETPYVALSRYQTKITYQDPIRSVSSIQIGALRAAGVGAENLLEINLNWNVTFVVNYLYEGEGFDEFAFL